MAPSAAPNPITEPFPISRIAGRYLLFNVDVISHVRRNHNICGMLVGTIPNLSQQNVFLGVPVELMPEEARVLVENGAAYIVDDVEVHRTTFREMSREERLKWLQEMDRRGEEVTKGTEELKERKKEKALKERGLTKEVLEKKIAEEPKSKDVKVDEVQPESVAAEVPNLGFIMKGSNFTDSFIEVPEPRAPAASSLFDYTPKPTGPAPNQTSKGSNASKHFVTPTTSYPPLPTPSSDPSTALPEVPKSYPLFRYLHSLKYYHMPGLRFGCHYNSYPGDPLRYHSHFAATGMGWDDEFELLDVVGGGRLATGTKKAYMIGGEDVDAKKKKEARKDGSGAGLFFDGVDESSEREVREVGIK